MSILPPLAIVIASGGFLLFFPFAVDEDYDGCNCNKNVGDNAVAIYGIAHYSLIRQHAVEQARTVP